MAEILYSGTPTLPYSFQFTPESDSPVLLYLSGSAFANNTQYIGLQLLIDGENVVSAAVWNNESNVHMALCPGIAKYTFPLKIESGNIKPVSISIEKLTGLTQFNSDDLIRLAIL